MASLSVLTASLPERHELLAECMASIRAQTLTPVTHLVSVDLGRLDVAVVYNRLASAVDTEWFSFIDDDDLADPDHLETMWSNSEDADVIYTGCRTVGHQFTQYNGPFDADLLRYQSLVPITCLVRTEVFQSSGGFRDEMYPDWRLWQRLSEAGARFRCVPKLTWQYRVHTSPEHKNRSYGELVG